ncbi:MAG TPA: dienelactone hydrolase family protein [Flavobacterium sp.]|nr:dienelactone hydrolase family protein [Flavobacterium sp.]
MKYILLTLALISMQFSNAQLKPKAYKDGKQILNGFSILPNARLKTAPGVLILPAWKGIDNHSKETAEKLAKLGYFAFIADIYGEGNYPKNNEEAGKQAGYYKTNYVEYQKRIALALDQLVNMGANKEKIVIMGYCFGGTGALEAARSNMFVKGVVSFHGGLARDASRKITAIKSKVLVCHGADDPYQSAEEITAFQQEMRTAKADRQMVYYANAVHAFTDPEAGTDNSKGAAYNEKADKRSWQLFVSFLKEVLE